MGAWWSALTVAEQVLYCIAIPSTLFLVLQTVMTLLGADFGGEGFNISDTSGLDLDLDAVIPDDISIDSAGADGGYDSPVSDLGTMRFFTLQGLLAFLCIFGWSSIIVLHAGKGTAVSVIVGLIFGFIAMFVVAKILQWSAKLTESGTRNLKNALGEIGRVYLTIPPKGEGSGKVNLTVQGNFMELDALNNSDEPIKTGESVRVVDIEGEHVVVEKE